MTEFSDLQLWQQWYFVICVLGGLVVGGDWVLEGSKKSQKGAALFFILIVTSLATIWFPIWVAYKLLVYFLKRKK